MSKPSYLNFDKAAYYWRPDVDYRARPDLYRVGKGEQGVLICEPYKSELLPIWRFRTPDVARSSSEAILARFKAYLANAWPASYSPGAQAIPSNPNRPGYSTRRGRARKRT